MAGAAERFACPSCGKQYKWKPDVARKKVRCAQCEVKFRVPSAAGGVAEPLEEGSSKPAPAKEVKPPKPARPTPEPPADDESYELNLGGELASLAPKGPVTPVPREQSGGGAAGSGDGRCPSCNQKVKSTAVICINCGFNLQAGKKLKTKVEQGDEPEPAGAGGKASGAVAAASANPFASSSVSAAASRVQYDADVAAAAERQARIQNLWGPLGVLGAGLGLLLINAAVLAPIIEAQTNATGIGGAGGAVAMAVGILVLAGVRLAIQFPLLFVIIFIVAKIFSSAYGPIGVVMLKLLAIALFTGVFGDSIELLLALVTGLGGVGCFGSILQIALVYTAFHALCAWLLEMDSGETIVSFLLLIFAPVVFLIFFGAMLVGMLP